MTDEHLFTRLEMWVSEEEDGKLGIRYDYSLPKIEDELTVQLYRILIETLCNEISSLEGAENLLDMDLVINNGEDDGELGV